MKDWDRIFNVIRDEDGIVMSMRVHKEDVYDRNGVIISDAFDALEKIVMPYYSKITDGNVQEYAWDDIALNAAQVVMGGSDPDYLAIARFVAGKEEPFDTLYQN